MNKIEFVKLNSKNIVAFLEDLFERRGNEEYLGEPVTMAQHMLQGAKLAEQNGENDITIVSALLHDVGHFTSEFGMFKMSDTSDKFHENSGAEVLKRFFPKLVTDCVKFHVAAKRYLCATDPLYMKKLSKASIHSLSLQGGPMSSKEVTDFEKNPHLEEILKVRILDDAGKDPNMKTPPFSYYAPRVQCIVDWHTKKI